MRTADRERAQGSAWRRARILYVSYGEGIGKMRLKLPAVKQGTARNMNRAAGIADLLAEME